MSKQIFFILLLTVFVGSSCKKSWLDVNDNPNIPPVTVSNYTFANALNTTAFDFWGNNSTGTYPNELGAYYSGQWTQSNSYILNPTIFTYQFTNTDFNFWDFMYNNLEDYEYVIQNAVKDEQPFFIGPSKVMKALVFQYLVDMYGNIPFSDALKLLGSITPQFDEQEAVYEGLIPMLDEAIADIKANPVFNPSVASSDIMFKGNATNWIQLANSLKLRILIRQSRVPGKESYITTEIGKIISEGTGFLTTDAASNPGYQAQASKQNPFYDRWGYGETGAVRSLGRFPRPTTFLFSTLINTNDTLRLKRMFYAIGGENPNTPGISTRPEIISNYKAIPFGATSGYTGPSTSPLGPCMIVRGQYKPVVIMSASEVQFLLAEAKQRYPSLALPSSAQEYYEQGIRESFRLLGANASGVETIIHGGLPDADWSASPDKLRAIAIQKWIALTNYAGLEAWCEYRRTNLPQIPQTVTIPDDPNKRPLRLFYPATELGSNQSNVEAQGTIDVFSTRIFWDVD